VVDVVRSAQRGIAKYFPRARAHLQRRQRVRRRHAALVRDATTDDTGTVSASRPLRTTNRHHDAVSRPARQGERHAQ
jgi:hypothetical protein